MSELESVIEAPPVFAMNCCPHCGWVLKMPMGKPTADIQAVMELYPEIPRQLFVCAQHGKWLHHLDDLFPVYWQGNKCKECV